LFFSENPTVPKTVSIVNQTSNDTESKMACSNDFRKKSYALSFMIMNSFFSLLDEKKSNYCEGDKISAKISTDGVGRQSNKGAFFSQEEKNRKKTFSPSLHFPKGIHRVGNFISNAVHFAFSF
jgi:hypothetical protein